MWGAGGTLFGGRADPCVPESESPHRAGDALNEFFHDRAREEDPAQTSKTFVGIAGNVLDKKFAAARRAAP